MRRRDLLALVAAAPGLRPFAAAAQQSGKLHRIGFLWDGPAVFPDALEAFLHGLRDLGYVEGRTIAIEYRWAEGKPERMHELAEELVGLGVEVIIAPSSIYTEAAKRATSGPHLRSRQRFEQLYGVPNRRGRNGSRNFMKLFILLVITGQRCD
jgi:putative ABC transport system substrate-binding protein